MNQDQANKIISRWREATKELEKVLSSQTLEFDYRWAKFTESDEKIIIQFHSKFEIFVCGTGAKYTAHDFDEIGEMIQ